MSEDNDDKDLEATPEKRRKARDEGQFARSQDGGAVGATIAVILCSLALAPMLAEEVGQFAVRCFSEPFALFAGDYRRIAQESIGKILMLCLPIAGAGALGAIAIGVVEAGWHPRFELAAPKWERLDPTSKLGQLFAPHTGMVNVAKMVLRVVVVGVVAYNVLRPAVPELTRLAQRQLLGAVLASLDVAVRLALWSTLALVLLAAADYGHNWFKHEKQIRMSREEMKEEHHQQEGDPKVKARQRARAREMARRSVKKELRTADVVVANPTHIAVALRYRPKEGAPVVVAKGYEDLALHIRKIAKEYGVPVVENKPLARALAAKVKVGKAIPVDLYAAVAEVLAFVYRMRNPRVRA